MTFIIDTADKIVPLLHQILMTLDKMEHQMASIADDVTALASAVTAVTADVKSVLAQLVSQPNLTADQQAQIEAQIAALQQLDATLQAAVTPPAPGPAPAPPQGRR